MTVLSYLNSIFSGQDGRPSAMRYLSAFVVLDVMLTWTAISIKTGALAPMDTQTAMLVAAALGFKAWQRSKEQ